MQETLKQLLAEGKTATVIQRLSALAPVLEKDLQDEILLQSTRFEQLEREDRSGRLSHEEGSLQRNRINAAVLAIVDRLPAGVQPPGTSRLAKWGGGLLAVVVVLLVAVAIIRGDGLQGLFGGAPTPREEPATPGSDDQLNIQSETIRQNTEGDQSPAVIGGDNVQINYGGDWEKAPPTAAPDSTQKE